MEQADEAFGQCARALPGHQLKRLYEAEAIAAGVQRVAAAIADQTASAQCLCVPVLKGSLMFAADLLRALPPTVEVDFLGVSSYHGGARSSGIVKLTRDISASIEDRDVLIVEDIVDTGLTIRYLLDTLALRRPRSLRVATLLDKPSRRVVEVPIDFCAFKIPDLFVVGYGLDYAEAYRGLPYLAELTLAENA